MTNKDSDIILDENKETTEDAAVSKKQMRAEKAEQQLQETLKKIRHRTAIPILDNSSA